MPRVTGDLTRQLNRTVTPDEAAAIRRYVARPLRAVMRTAFGGYLTLAAIFTGAFAMDRLLGNERSLRVLVWVHVALACGFVLLLLLQSRRLRSLRGLDTLPVHRVESPMEGPYARLFSPEAFKRDLLFD